MNSKDTIRRQSAIELLRIIAMAGVIILHYNNGQIGGGLKFAREGSIHQYMFYLTENLFAGAVDLFVMISAYFLCTTKKRKTIKVFELIFQVVLFQEAFYLARIFLVKEQVFTIKSFIGNLLPINYFVILYSALYLISPYVNTLIHSLSKKNFQKLLITVLIVFSVWTIFVDALENAQGIPLNGLSTVGMYGSQKGYSIVNFILVYFVGAYIRIHGINMKNRQLIWSGIGILAVNYIWSMGEHSLGLSSISAWNYNNPLIILFAAIVLVLFSRVHFYNKGINELAKGAFTCFLFHGTFMTHLGIEKAVASNVFLMLLHQILVAVVLYLTSYMVYKIYTLCTSWFVKWITPVVNRINISLEEQAIE